MTGDCIIAAVRIGAMLRQMGGEQSLHIAAVSPQNVASGNPSNAIGYAISVNANGERFTDESLGYVNHGKALMSQPGQTCALIFDTTTKESVDKVQIVIEQFEKLDIPIVQADTIEDLAAQIDVDPAVLRKTVDEFNAASDGDKTSGLAVDKTALAVKVETAPRLGYECCDQGFRLINDRLPEANAPIEGLWHGPRHLEGRACAHGTIIRACMSARLSGRRVPFHERAG